MNLHISLRHDALPPAANKARTDVETILDQEGFLDIGPRHDPAASTARRRLDDFAGIVKAAARVKRGDTLLVQYPLRGYFNYITRRAKAKGARIIILIHDLESLREKRLTAEKEAQRLSRADHIIATSAAMGRHLRSIGVDKPMSSLDAWDYLTTTDPIPARVRSGADDRRVAYAGALNRRQNRFLWNWGDVIKGYDVDIYGSGFRMDQVARAERFYDHGFVESEKIIAGMTSDYGLEWEGTSLDSCKGDYGEYLAVNTPHKVSLYIRAQLPIIIWSGAAMAPFVVANKIGFTVDTLSQIDEKMAKVTAEQYAEMKANVEAMSRLISSGHFTRRAVKAALASLSAADDK